MGMTTATSDSAQYIAAINAMKRARGVAILAHNYQAPEIFHSVTDMATQVHVDADVAARARLAVERMLQVGRGVRR
jgi:quinolinate synthase